MKRVVDFKRDKGILAMAVGLLITMVVCFSEFNALSKFAESRLLTATFRYMDDSSLVENAVEYSKMYSIVVGIAAALILVMIMMNYEGFPKIANYIMAGTVVLSFALLILQFYAVSSNDLNIDYYTKYYNFHTQRFILFALGVAAVVGALYLKNNFLAVKEDEKVQTEV